MQRNYLDIKETLLKYEMYYIFCAISDVYGKESLNKFVSYVKNMYGCHFDMEIHMGDKYLTFIDGDICMKENTLEW